MPGRRCSAFKFTITADFFLFYTLDSNAKMASVMKLKIAEHEKCVAEHKCPTIAPALSNMQCQGGRVGEYECNNVDLLAFVSGGAGVKLIPGPHRCG